MCLALFAMLLTAGAPALRAQTATPQLRVTSCEVVVAGYGGQESTGAQMLVRFENISPDTLKTIVWRAKTPAGTIDFTDRGTFSPRVSIYRRPQQLGAKFHLDPFARPHLSLDVMGPGVCSPIQTVTAAGDVWKASGAEPAAIHVPAVPSDSDVTVPATFENPEHNPVGIISCQYTIVRGHAYGSVRFRNLSPQTIDSITFRAFYGQAGIDFTYNGRFSPNVLIKSGDMSRRDLPANAPDEYVTLDSPSSCVALNARYSDGTLWQNPSVAATAPPFPVDPTP
jgi:hypothetical protein